MHALFVGVPLALAHQRQDDARYLNSPTPLTTSDLSAEFAPLLPAGEPKMKAADKATGEATRADKTTGDAHRANASSPRKRTHEGAGEAHVVVGQDGERLDVKVATAKADPEGSSPDTCKPWCHYSEHPRSDKSWSVRCTEAECGGCGECVATTSGQQKLWLPVFNTSKALEADSMWSTYFRRVYGELPTSFPLDVSDFQIFYEAYLPYNYLQSLKSWHGDSKSDGCPTTPRQVYRHMSVIDTPRSAYVWHPPRVYDTAIAHAAFREARVSGRANTEFWKDWGIFPAYGAHAVVEVTHCTGRVVSRCEQYSTWMYAQKGSGIFFNIGRTIAFETHREAVLYFLEKKCQGHCEHEYQQLVTVAARKGYDTMQFTRVGDQLCGLTSIEIVATRGNGTRVCELNYTTGWGGDKQCFCDADLKCANCQHNNPDSGRINTISLKRKHPDVADREVALATDTDSPSWEEEMEMRLAAPAAPAAPRRRQGAPTIDMSNFTDDYLSNYLSNYGYRRDMRRSARVTFSENRS